MNSVRAISLCLTLAMLGGCAGSGGLGSVSKLSQLQRGMTTGEVKSVLGEPASVQLIDGLPIWRYSLHEYFVGWVPYYFVFNYDNQLVAWQANMNEYYANQQMMMSVIRSLQQSPQAGSGASRGGGVSSGGRAGSGGAYSRTGAGGQ